MSVAPQELLESAKLIHSQITNEAGHRAAISRAYYASFHAARGFHAALPSPGSVDVANGAHEQLAEQLQNPTVPTTDSRHLSSRRIGVILKDFLRRRIVADYRVAQVVPDTAADEALAIGEKLLALAA